MTGFSEICSFRIYGHEATWPHGKKATWQETVSHEECIYMAVCSAMVLQSIHLFQSHCIVFSPTHPCLYIYIATFFTPGLYRIDIGVFLAL